MSWCFISWFISLLQATEKWYVMVFPFQFPLLSLQSLPRVQNFTEIKKKKLPGWLDFPLLSQLYCSGSSDLFCNQRGQLGTAWAQGMGKSGWHMAPQLLWDLRRTDFRWKGCVLPAPWVKEECVCWEPWHWMGIMVKRGRSRLQIPFLPRSLGFIFLVRVHHTTGNYASFLPHSPGFDFSSSCVAELVQVKLLYSKKVVPLQVIKLMFITLSPVKGISVIPILQV